MGNFVNPKPIRLPIGDVDYIDIKERLNHGETEEMYARWAPFVVPGEPAHLNRREVRTAKALMYLLGWSLTNDEGTPVPFFREMPEAERLDTIRSLDPDRFDDIHAAIETHEEAYAKKKKLPAAESASPAISPSPVAVAGPMTTSVN